MGYIAMLLSFSVAAYLVNRSSSLDDFEQKKRERETIVYVLETNSLFWVLRLYFCFSLVKWWGDEL
jgi:hypothetical protein